MHLTFVSFSGCYHFHLKSSHSLILLVEGLIIGRGLLKMTIFCGYFFISEHCSSFVLFLILNARHFIIVVFFC